MTPQPSLFDQSSPRIPRGWSVGADFRRFHEENPHVYAAIVSEARAAMARGADHWGMKGIFEVIRWNSAMKTSGDECFKLDNR